MSKHTPAPWFVQDGFLTIYNLSEGTVGTTCAIAKVLREQPGDDQAEANARLIAAAPDLYDAADAALNVLIACCVPTDGVDDRKAIVEAQGMLRAAIRKATGEA